MTSARKIVNFVAVLLMYSLSTSVFGMGVKGFAVCDAKAKAHDNVVISGKVSDTETIHRGTEVGFVSSVFIVERFDLECALTKSDLDKRWKNILELKVFSVDDIHSNKYSLSELNCNIYCSFEHGKHTDLDALMEAKQRRRRMLEDFEDIGSIEVLVDKFTH